MKSRMILVPAILIPAISFSQPATSPQIEACEARVISQAVAAQNPSREFLLDLRGPNESRLIYVGVRHTFNPDDPQYAEMQRIWNELQPTEAFFEGTGRFVGDTVAAALRQSGEPGLVRYLASRAGIPAHSLEPTREAEVAALLPHFTLEQLLLFFVTRSVIDERERRSLPQSALEPYLLQYLTVEHRTPQFANVLPDLPAFRAAYHRWFPEQEPELAPVNWLDPFYTSAQTGSKFLNDINRESSAFRDLYMYRMLANASGPSARIFAEVGRDHIPAQAEALRCALKP